MKSTHPRVVVVLMLCASILLPTFVTAQDDDEVTRQLATYQLTITNVNKVKAVLDELKRRGVVDAVQQKDDESLDKLLKRVEKDATMSRILRGAGITARDFVLTLTAVTAVSLASGVSGDTSGKSLPPELRRHQQFMNQNQAAFAPLLKAIFD